MNAKQKTFITKKLIPFILREQGRGFAMSNWMISKLTPGVDINPDGLHRLAPKCGTVACIGGSISVLTGAWDDAKAGAKIGLTPKQAEVLFYGWRTSWPEPFKARYVARKTAIGKAKVAVALLREVVRTNGACLGA